MKKYILTVLAMLLALSLCGCGILFPTGSLQGNGQGDSNTVSLRIVYPESEELLEIKPYESKDITPVVIEGKILLGYYGKSEATGFEYFNYRGEMNGEWRTNYPDTVYAIYEDIDYSMEYKTEIKCHEEPHSYYCAGRTVKLSKIPSDVRLASIMHNTPNLNAIITLHADIKQNGEYESETTVKFGMGAETFKTEDFPSNPSSYSHISLSHTVSVLQLETSGDRVYVNFDWHDGSIGSYGLVKNVYYTVKILEN